MLGVTSHAEVYSNEPGVVRGGENPGIGQKTAREAGDWTLKDLVHMPNPLVRGGFPCYTEAIRTALQEIPFAEHIMSMAPKILLVENDEDHAFLFMRALRQSGLEVEVDHATDGKAAVDYLQSRRKKKGPGGRMPDLVLLDIGLPVLNGFEVLQWLSSQPELGRKTRAIFLTNSEDPEDRKKALKLQAAGYWMKPSSLKGDLEMMENLKQQLLDLKAASSHTNKRTRSSGAKIDKGVGKPQVLGTKQKGIEPPDNFFLNPKGENLRKAILRRPDRWGEILLMIVGIRGRKGQKKRHFGLAGFYLS
jgi:CheY-like chemotaxis protein